MRQVKFKKSFLGGDMLYGLNIFFKKKRGSSCLKKKKGHHYSQSFVFVLVCHEFFLMMFTASVFMRRANSENC